jgi:A/G-specific adenine glycosylase
LPAENLPDDAERLKRPLRRRLLAWYDRSGRDLPWRREPSPYRVWVAEIIFQQTRIEQGLPYYHRFLERFPDVAALAGAHPDALMKAWEGLGYYSRARNLQRAAQVIVGEHDGRFPERAADWQSLPGVGPYTARAIASITAGEPVAVVDGNVVRVLSRVFDIDRPAHTTPGRRLFQTLADALVAPRRPGDFNQAVMDLGATVCVPRNPLCEACPWAAPCRARARGNQAERPVKRPRVATPHYEEVALVIERDGALLLGRRPRAGLLGGLWELPCGRVEPGEDHAASLRRVAREILGAGVRVGGLVGSANHAYSHFRVTLSAYRCRLASGGEPRPVRHDALAWVAPSDLGAYALPRVHHKVLGNFRFQG